MLTQPPPQMGTRAWWRCGAPRKLPERPLNSNLPASRTYLMVAAIQHITQLHDHRVAADPHRPLRIILRQHPSYAQRCYNLSNVAVHIADCNGPARESAESVAASMRAYVTSHRGLHTCGAPHQAQSRAAYLCVELHKPSTPQSPSEAKVRSPESALATIFPAACTNVGGAPLARRAFAASSHTAASEDASETLSARACRHCCLLHQLPNRLFLPRRALHALLGHCSRVLTSSPGPANTPGWPSALLRPFGAQRLTAW